ncbi:MAG TPA: sulfite exporter TauE/SafE family protein [Acetobacteraceae bacterium]|nr:sulfite exporter TauE/SafE family protein [Acetobacteraceae bacterium]
MTLGVIVGIAAVGIAIGVAVGAVGIGGVLLVPFLTLTLGIDVKRAIAAALLSYVPSCIVAVALYARHGSIRWREAGWLCLAALPTAWLGARTTQYLSPALLEAAIGVLLLAGGIYALFPPRGGAIRPRRLASVTLLGLGGGTGFVSALTGAGGAFVLLPLLLLLDFPVLAAIGLGQAIALPIAGLASVANIAAGIMDLGLAAGLAVALTLGVAIGTPIAHALPQRLLRRLLGSAVVIAGLAMLLRTAARLAGAA